MRNLLLALLLIPAFSFGQKPVSSYPKDTVIDNNVYLLGYSSSKKAVELFPYPSIAIAIADTIYDTTGGGSFIPRTFAGNVPVDFSTYAMNFLNVNNFTGADLAGNTIFNFNKSGHAGMLNVNTTTNDIFVKTINSSGTSNIPITMVYADSPSKTTPISNICSYLTTRTGDYDVTIRLNASASSAGFSIYGLVDFTDENSTARTDTIVTLTTLQSKSGYKYIRALSGTTIRTYTLLPTATCTYTCGAKIVQSY